MSEQPNGTQKVGPRYGTRTGPKIYLQAGIPAADAAALAGLVTPIFTDGALPARIKLFALYLVCLSKGNEEEALNALDLAIDSGLSEAELREGLLAGVLSRGMPMLWKGLPALRALAGEPDDAGVTVASSGVSTEELHSYFDKVFGGTPEWLRLLVELRPDYAQAYYAMRRAALVEHAIPTRHKELMIVAINAAQLYRFGILHHLKGAFAAGASRAEAAEAILVGATVGGMPAWIEGAPLIAEALEAVERKS